ncbi:MAG: hypothetical protein QOE63_612 [Acidimicrobiaceae bacterium]
MARALRWTGQQIRLLFDVHANPATFVYLFTLIVTSAVVSEAGSQLSNELLRTQSTNLANLHHHPLHVLFTSAFWLDSGVRPILLVVPFALVLAPAERWLGTRRALAVFALGHVGATILTAGIIELELDHGWANRSLTHTIDVGFSYGFAAIVGVLSYHVTTRWRARFIGAVGAALVIIVVAGATYGDIGHLFAWAIGLACHVLVPQDEATPRVDLRHGPVEADEVLRKR